MTADRPSLIYLDHHATTPVHSDVWEEMKLFSSALFYNPSGLYSGSLQVQERIQAAVSTVRKYLKAPGHEVVFTSGATEANNLALKCFHGGQAGRAFLVSPTEHKSVIATADYLHRRWHNRMFLGVDTLGHVDLADLEAKLRQGASLVSVMAVNNEVGTIARIAEILRICHAHGALFHCDATQAMDNVGLDLTRLPIDLLSFSAHKIYGPKGIGCLLVSENALEQFSGPHIHGGAQQLGLRAGTENVAGIIGLAKALDICGHGFERNASHRRKMRDRLLTGLQSNCDIVVNGDQHHRHPGNLHVSFRGVAPQRFFSRCGRIAFSTGSACNSTSGELSHVLKHLGLSTDDIKSSMRLSVGTATTEDEIDAAIDILASAQKGARA